MAKLYSYYGLCPLIDPTSLLGVTEDYLSGCVIVTLGKNIVIRYKLSDQKQIGSWSTRDRLTTAVVYDCQTEKYVAAFASNQLRVWSAKETQLDRVKKLKVPIHTILTQPDGPSLIIFHNGTCSSLEYALDNRKEARKSVVDEGNTIVDQLLLSTHNQLFLCYLVQTKEKVVSCIVLELDNENYTERINTVKIQKINRADSHAKLIGSTFVSDEGNSQLLTLWSDGRLFSLKLFLENLDPSVGCFLSRIETLSPKSPIVMTSLNSNYVAMYGADANEEGASVIIYNIQFKIIQSRQRFKLYGLCAKLNAIGNCLLLAASKSLAVVPYDMATEQLAAIVGSQKVSNLLGDDDIKIISEMEIVDWDFDSKKKTSDSVSLSLNMPNIVKSLLNEFYKEGYPESIMVEHILPLLFEKKNIEAIKWCITHFKDIPESLLVKLLNFCLKSEDALFGRVEIKTKMTDDKHCLLSPAGRRELVNLVLNIRYSDVNLLPHLQTNLQFSETLKLLNYLCYLVSENNTEITLCEDPLASENKIYEWASILLESHYQEFILSRDEEVLNTIKYFRKALGDQLHYVNVAKTTLSILQRLQSGKSISGSNQCQTSKLYSIEKVKL